MIISPSKRFIFVHVPKTAGTSLSAALTPFGWSWLQHPHTKHETITEFHQRTFGLFRCYFSFGFVRNPWDRALSAYHFVRAQTDKPVPDNLTSFERFLADIESGAGWTQSFKLVSSQAGFLLSRAGQPAVDFIGRYEHLQRDIARVEARLGLSIRLSHLNATPTRAHYSQFYTVPLAEAVARLWHADTEAFGYEFEGVPGNQPPGDRK